MRGVLRRNPSVNIVRAQDAGLSGSDDPEVLEWAAREGRILFTHDASTMTRHAYDRVRADLTMPGLFEVPQSLPVGHAIEEVQSGRAVSIEAALAALRANAGLAPVATRASPPVQRPQEAQAPLEAMLEEMKLLRGAVEGMSRRLAAQESQNRELGERLRETISRERGLSPGERHGERWENADQGKPPEPERSPWDRVRRWLRRRGEI